MAFTIIKNGLFLTAPDSYYKCNLGSSSSTWLDDYEYTIKSQRDVKCNQNSECDGFRCTIRQVCTYYSLAETPRADASGNDFCKKRDVPSSSEAPIHIATTKPPLPKSTTAAPVKPKMAPPLQNYPPPTSVKDISSPSAKSPPSTSVNDISSPYPQSTPVKDISSPPAKYPPSPSVNDITSPYPPPTPVKDITSPPAKYPPSTSENDITSPYPSSTPAKDISSPPAEYPLSTPTVEAEKKKGVAKEVTKTCKNDWKRSNRNCAEPVVYDETGECPISGCEATHCCKAPASKTSGSILVPILICLAILLLLACLICLVVKKFRPSPSEDETAAVNVEAPKKHRDVKPKFVAPASTSKPKTRPQRSFDSFSTLLSDTYPSWDTMRKDGKFRGARR